jgi:outer membrane protein OmpA-like peptidoglycan-associated protein
MFWGWKYILVLLFLMGAMELSGQTMSKKLFRLLNNHYFEQALKIADEKIKLDSSDYGSMYAAAICHLHEYSASKSLYYLRKIVAKCPKLDPEVYNALGQAFHANYLFDSAIATYYKFLLAVPDMNEYRKNHTIKLIEESQNAKRIYKQASPYFIKNLGLNINSFHPDHSPALSPDGTSMTFASKNTHSNNLGHETFFEDIFEVRLLEDSTWSKPTRLSMAKHQIPLSFFDGGQKMLVYRYSKHGNLYVSEKKDGQWSLPYKLKGINTPAFEGHGHIFNNGKSIVFSSNKGSKNGDLDLFISHKKANGKWSKAYRLPKEINSEFDEDSPFMLNDGCTLFFSSKGHNTTGGFDVFKACKDPKTDQWMKPQNLGHPVNTPRDDLFFTLDSTASFGFISSNRDDSRGGKDLYYIGITQQPELQGRVLLDTQALSHFKIKFSNIRTREDFITTSDEKGGYSLTLPSGESYSVNFSSKNLTLEGPMFEVPKAKVAEFTMQKDFLLESQSFATLHSIGEVFVPSYAEKIKKRFEGTLLDAEGNLLGKSFVLLVSKSGEIVSKVSVENNGHFLISAVLNPNEKYWINIERNGLKFNELILIDPTELSPDSLTVLLNITIKEIKKGDVFAMRNIYFESNSTDIPYEFIGDLERLAKFLSDNPNLHIEVSGHADNLGEDAFNLWLSKQRAVGIQDFLIKKGISSERISVKAFGSSRPAKPNLSREKRQFNRRCEIEIKEL